MAAAEEQAGMEREPLVLKEVWEVLGEVVTSMSTIRGTRLISDGYRTRRISLGVLKLTVPGISWMVTATIRHLEPTEHAREMACE